MRACAWRKGEGAIRPAVYAPQFLFESVSDAMPCTADIEIGLTGFDIGQPTMVGQTSVIVLLADVTLRDQDFVRRGSLFPRCFPGARECSFAHPLQQECAIVDAVAGIDERNARKPDRLRHVIPRRRQVMTVSVCAGSSR